MVKSNFRRANTSSIMGLNELFLVPRVRLTRVNRTSDSLERSLARSDRSSLVDVLLSSEVQVYKIIVVSPSYDRSVHDLSYTIIRVNNQMYPVLALAYAKS